MGPMSFGKSLLAMGDAHVQPGEPEAYLRRFNAFGRLAVKYKPDCIVLGGDIWDIPSLAGHMGSKAVGGSGSTLHHQGKRLGADIEAGKDAIRRILRPIQDYNRACGRAGRSYQKYEPLMVGLLGNHEKRTDKACNNTPELADVINSRDLIAKWWQEQGFEIYDGERETFWYEGAGFRHFFQDKKGNPIQITTAKTHLPRSSVWFHQHSFATTERRYDGMIDRFLAMPCYKPPHRLGEKENSGVVFLNDMKNGDFSICEVPYERVLAHDLEVRRAA